MTLALPTASLPMPATARHIAAFYDGFLVDLWGVVHDGRALFDDAAATLERLVAMGKKVIFLSNTSRRDAGIATMLDDLGLPRTSYAGVITAGDIAYDLVMPCPAGKYLFGRKAYVVGTQPGDDWAMGPGIERTALIEAADFVLTIGLAPSGLEREQVTDDLAHAIARNLPLVCANPDRNTMIGDRVVECVGTIAGEYEHGGGHVIWCGKPATTIFEKGIAKLAPISPNRICMIGDSLETDICGGIAAGLATVMVARKGSPGANDLATAPDYVLTSLRW